MLLSDRSHSERWARSSSRGFNGQSPCLPHDRSSWGTPHARQQACPAKSDAPPEHIRPVVLGRLIVNHQLDDSSCCQPPKLFDPADGPRATTVLGAVHRTMAQQTPSYTAQIQGLPPVVQHGHSISGYVPPREDSSQLMVNVVGGSHGSQNSHTINIAGGSRPPLPVRYRHFRCCHLAHPDVVRRAPLRLGIFYLCVPGSPFLNPATPSPLRCSKTRSVGASALLGRDLFLFLV